MELWNMVGAILAAQPDGGAAAVPVAADPSPSARGVLRL